MIFVTVGTHEQPFDRLVKKIDELAGQGKITEKVFVQTGFCNYIPQNCEWKKLLSYDEMEEMFSEARIVITHGGPASFLAPLNKGKIPIVVPRSHEYNEHVNDHQVKFVKSVKERMGMVIAVTDMDELERVIVEYDEIVDKMKLNNVSNNTVFNERFEKIVDGLFG